jgi:hypothetical protein
MPQRNLHKTRLNAVARRPFRNCVTQLEFILTDRRPGSRTMPDKLSDRGALEGRQFGGGRAA